eukprot:CAMPEP_0196589614 /NCGR_PEP_ID=MMETSP1081-20130531/64067_1 /TAXON_ID=36882 /ORGANISM="Pyramimonas amylifera, Strain CCMP720" /LENGTH=65 /DNA_ID=CAMNT_0041912463 /DNA_START=182 /DNA_END=376 /DNA_ORIENTATION=-
MIAFRQVPLAWVRHHLCEIVQQGMVLQGGLVGVEVYIGCSREDGKTVHKGVWLPAFDFCPLTIAW